MKNTSKANEIAQIAIAVSTIIVGGYGILILSSPLAIPGMKYIMMSPYLSLVMSLLLNRIKKPYVILKTNAVFAGIMSMINLYMGLSIIMSGLLTELMRILLKADTSWTRRIVTSMYSAFVLLTALPVSKYLIGGGAFELISNRWIIVSATIAFGFGLIGSITGEFINKRISAITG